MPNPLVAIAGASVVGTGVSISQSGSAQRAAERSSAQQQAFDQQRLDEWNNTYGDIQDKLATYYENVTPDYYAATGLENFNRELEAAKKRVSTTLEQRGLAGSGIEASFAAQAELAGAEGRARIRRDAPREMREDQHNFLRSGLRLDPSNEITNANANRTNQLLITAESRRTEAGKAVTNTVTSVGNAAMDYYRTNANANASVMAGTPTIDYSVGVV